MAQRQTFTKALGAAVAGALLLAACGGGDSNSRTRNASPIAPEEGICWVVQQEKDQYLARLGRQIERASAAASRAEDVRRNYDRAANAAQRAYDAWVSAGSPNDGSHPLSMAYDEAKGKANEAYGNWREVQALVDQVTALNEQVSSNSNKPLCSDLDGEADVTTSSDDTISDDNDNATSSTASSTDGVGGIGGAGGAAGIGNCTRPEAYVMKNRLAVGDVTTVGMLKCGNLQGVITVPDGLSSVPSQTDTEYVWTLQALVPGGYRIELFYIDPATLETSSKQPFIITVTGDITNNTTQSPPTTSTVTEPEPVECHAPISREGVSRTVKRDQVLTISAEMCEATETLGIYWADNDNGDIVTVGEINGGYRIDVRFKKVGPTRIGVVSTANMSEISALTWVDVTVLDPATELCAGKAPNGEWNADLNGGTFTASKSCDDAVLLFTSVSKYVGKGLEQQFRGYLVNDFSYNDLIQRFGAGTFEVQLIHALGLGDDFALVGDTTELEITYTAPDPEGTVSNGAISNERARDGVASLPVFALAPAASDEPVNPRAASAETPVVAVSADTSLLTCDEQCIAGVVARAGFDTGVVEISVNGGKWVALTASSSTVLPPAAASLRVRVTPESGDPVILQTVITRESTAGAYTAVSKQQPVTVTSADITSADNGTSIPWVVIVALIALILVAVFGRRLLQGKAAATND